MWFFIISIILILIVVWGVMTVSKGKISERAEKELEFLRTQESRVTIESMPSPHSDLINYSTPQSSRKVNQNKLKYKYEIVGEQSYQQNLRKIAGPKEDVSKSYECMAKVISEPTNKYDKNAVKVEINGLLVGYINKAEAKKVSGRKVNKIVPAVIDGGWVNDDSEGSYGGKLAIGSIGELL